MHYISSLAVVTALASLAIAGDAPVVKGNPIGTTYSATIPQTNAKAVSGACLIASSPDQEGVNIQIALYNLPGGGNLCTSLS